ncbi:MAG: alpha/beta hydrolase [Oscillospiraceae bacterium]
MSIAFQKAMSFVWSVISKTDAKRIAKQVPPSGVKVIENIPYANDEDKMHLLNIYLPEISKAQKLPTIIDIHGGGWMYGDKDLNKYYCMYLSSKGYAVMGMSYHLVPQTDLKGQVQDVFRSLNWLDLHSDEFNFDLNNVLLTGDSSGGHLTGLIGSIIKSEKLQKIYDVTVPSFNFSMLAISHGVFDLDFTGFPRFLSNEVKKMLLSNNEESADILENMSFKDTSKDVALPPVMLISSEADPLHSQTFEAQKYLESRNSEFCLKYWTKSQGKKLSHVFNITHYEWNESKQTNDAMLEIFKNVIQKSVHK